jgi:hypothetical protein
MRMLFDIRFNDATNAVIAIIATLSGPRCA